MRCWLIVSLYSVHFTFVVALLDALALVIFMFTACECNHEFGKTSLVYEESGGDYCESGVLYGLLQFPQLLALKQQLSVASGGVVVVRTVEIFGYIHILHPKLGACEYAVCVDKACLAESDGFYFGAA